MALPAEGNHSTVLQPETGHNQSRGPEPDSTLPEAGLFFGKRFLLVGFGTEAEAQLSLLVIENGGRVLTGRTRIVADYAVVPLLGCPVEATVDEVVTDTWLVRTWLMNIYLNNCWVFLMYLHCSNKALGINMCDLETYATLFRPCVLRRSVFSSCPPTLCSPRFLWWMGVFLSEIVCSLSASSPEQRGSLWWS